MTPRLPAAERLHKHSLTRVIVLEQQQIMFLPIPKSGCTSVLWTLADLAGLPRSRFEHSQTDEVSRPMAIHDTGLWEPGHRWLTHDETERERIQASPDWLRFSIVRDPAPRLWSAWQSKILLREPRFVKRFADEPWFPGPTPTLADIVSSFRDFVHALDTSPDTAPHDAHWGPQSQLMQGFVLNFVGRAEQMAGTMRRLSEHVGVRAQVQADVPRENTNPVPYHPSVYDEETAAIMNRVFAEDFAAFDYPLLDASGLFGDDEWRASASSRLAHVNELVDRHLRIGELLAALDESERDSRRRIKDLIRTNHRLQREAASAGARVRAIEESTSWRITRPLRGLRRGNRSLT